MKRMFNKKKGDIKELQALKKVQPRIYPKRKIRVHNVDENQL